MNDKCFIIAEIAQAHDGSLGILHSYIDALSSTGIDAIKFQTHIAEAESSKYESFRIPFSYVDKTRYDYWSRVSFSREQWVEIKSHCEAVGLEFMSSPFSQAAVDLLESIGMSKYKIGSGEVSNLLMLEKIAKTGKDIILSSGMSSYSELDETVRFIQNYGNKLSILQCTTKYPTQAADVGLNVIKDLQNKYNVPIGLSDHSGKIYPSLAAVSLGAKVLEFHAVFDRNMFGPDSKSSITLSEIKTLVKGVRFIEESLYYLIDKNNNTAFKEIKEIFEKSLCVNKNKTKGDVIEFNDLESKKPRGMGLDAKNYQKIIGKKLNKSLKKWDFLRLEDIK